MKTLYLAAGVFGVAERMRNARLAQIFQRKGRKVVLPQHEAKRFFVDGVLDQEALAEDCRRAATDPDTICVVCIDGPDADAGAAVEYGCANQANGRGITWRSDFRTAEEKELGRNAMFRLKGTTHIYLPCYAVEFEELQVYYDELAEAIHQAALKIEASEVA